MAPASTDLTSTRNGRSLAGASGVSVDVWCWAWTSAARPHRKSWAATAAARWKEGRYIWTPGVAPCATPGNGAAATRAKGASAAAVAAVRSGRLRAAAADDRQDRRTG